MFIHQQQRDRQMKRLSTQKVSDEMHAFLWDRSIELNESIASIVRGLIRKEMEESKVVVNEVV